MVTTFSRSASGNTTRASEELNGPMIASTFSSFTRVRTPMTAWSGLPAESKTSIRELPAVDAAGRVDLVHRDPRGDLVGLREADERTRPRGHVAEDQLLGRRRGRRRPEAEHRAGRRGDESVELHGVSPSFRLGVRAGHGEPAVEGGRAGAGARPAPSWPR